MNDHTMGFFWKKTANGPYFSLEHSLSNSILALERFYGNGCKVNINRPNEHILI